MAEKKPDAQKVEDKPTVTTEGQETDQPGTKEVGRHYSPKSQKKA